MLGKGDTTFAFTSTEIDFYEEHVFDPGPGGETQVLWVSYRNTQPSIFSLEVHRLTQQAVVPLNGEIIQVVAASQPDGSPDLDTLSAFRVRAGQGICMQVGCWHTTRVSDHQVNCMMLTRRSTTIDLIAHLCGASSLTESEIVSFSQHRILNLSRE